MKIILTFFVLLFSSSVFADDISDFQIEGISVGDSLLDYVSEEEIQNEIKVNKKRYNNNTSFGEVFISKEFLTYESVNIFVKPNDSNYIIYSITGAKEYKTIDLCIKEQNEIATKFSNLFTDVKKTNNYWKSRLDPTGRSTVDEIGFIFKSGDQIVIKCIDIEEQLSIKQKWWSNTLDIAIDRKEIIDWFISLN